ncbi:MAG: ParB/RepB/Spo0J family partition protein, partial [Frankiales bacterium]|nr:ParB/RepB/Spo0J family partition protein [Frankiales bacterium]
VVEQLVAPDVAATADSIVHIPVRFVVPHPRNRKILDDDVADLVAEFKAGIPILNPLGVTAAADWNAGKPDDLKEIGPLEFIITAGGHRRLRAAELAKLPTVPCIVRGDFAGAEGRKAALLENLHRQDLDPFEEAEAFTELTSPPYKLSQRALATIVGCNQSHISKRLKLAKLPSAVREQVRCGKRTIADAVALARVVDQGPIFDAAWKHMQTSTWISGERAVEEAIANHEATVKRAKALDELRATGVAVTEQRPSWWPDSKTKATTLEALELDPAKHTEGPCHAAYLGQDGAVELICSNPGNHLGATKLVKLPARVATRINSRGAGDQEAKQRRERKELKKLQPGRAAIARQIIYGEAELSTEQSRQLLLRGLVGAAFHLEGGRAEPWKVLRDLLGPRIGEIGDYPQLQHTSALARRLPADVLQRLLALTYFEGLCRSFWRRWDEENRWYLDLLAEHGYEISSLEKQKLAKVGKDDEEQPQCHVCMATTLDVGATWITNSLCSGCSDAADAGWLPGEETEAVAEAVTS